MITDSKILKAIFFIQLVSSFLVVVGHFTADVLDFTSPFWVLALNQLSRYGTVLLTIVSGYLTAFSFEKKNPTWRQFFTGKLIYIYIPFLLSGVLYHYLLHNGMPHTREDFINILLGKTGAHLYFIFMICQYYVFAYVFRNWITKKNIPYLIWVFMIVQYVYINYLHQGWLGLTTRHMLPSWIFTFYLGHMIYWYRESILPLLRKKQAVLILFTGISTSSAAYFVMSSKLFVAVHLVFVFACVVTFLVMMVFLLELVDVIKIRFHKGLTYYIYLFHSACLILLNEWVKGQYGDLAWLFTNKWYSLLYLAVVYFCTGLFSILVARLFQNIEAFVKNRAKLQQDAA
ncbi:acyltransferase [Brevibacillus fluminis]|uniref:Acyltransferase n=1 Tax=Brevibacillus fluminis TaxID=511487 RepID=A0A3M8CXJ3_9BACL|nr:acyltransferase [Brevibacillus fluminis]RNB79585.1 acyltransferase [Brevibacillus fluminis]